MKRSLEWAIACVLISIAVSTLSIANTPDGEPPATEEVCDVLKSATPGLYGLCVAYCEAQDSLIGSVSDPGAPKSLINYYKKKKPDDPHMPCLQQTLAYSYVFNEQNPGLRPWAPGASLTGQINGIVDPLNSDRVIIKGFNSAVLARPAGALPNWVYDSIDSSEFNTSPVHTLTPVMSFSGAILHFRSCPGGFTNRGVPDFDFIPPFNDCPFGFAPGGGFLMSYDHGFAPMGFATAADGTGNSPLCSPGPPTAGCRVLDIPIDVSNWGLVALPDSATVDQTMVIGRNSVIEDHVVIDAGVTIGSGTTISEGAHVCPNATVGSTVIIGENRLVDTGVTIPDGISQTDVAGPPGPCT